MINRIKKFFGVGPKTDFADLVRRGAIILDVRSKGEYAQGHIEGSINIPVNKLDDSVDTLTEENKLIITCCASGMRSAQAKRILESRSFSEVYNGGSWYLLQKEIK